MPFEYSLSDNSRRVILKHDRIDTDSDGIFPIGIKNWEIVHAKNPMLPKDKYHRTNKNLSKTRQLYPAIYSATKDMDESSTVFNWKGRSYFRCVKVF